MPGPYTEQQLRRIWLISDLSEFRKLLPHAFTKLYEDPAPSEEYIFEWVTHLKTSFTAELDYDSHGDFVKDFIKYDGVRALLRLAESPSPNARISRSLALETFVNIARVGTFGENKQVGKKIYDEGGVAVFRKCLNSQYFTERAGAAIALRGVCAYAEFGEFCTAEEIAAISTEFLEYALKGHQSILDETFDPEKSFQMYQLGQESPEATRHFAPFWAGKVEENATWVVHSLLCRTHYPSRKECLTIVEHEPKVFDLLLKVAVRSRTPWFPGSGADAMAAETLYHFLMFPYGFIPGLRTDGDSIESKEFSDEIECTIRCWKIFIKLPRWREKLVEVWQKLDDESYEQINRKFETSKQYLVPDEQPEGFNVINLMIQRRGFIRVSLLKIFLTMTYLPPSLIPPSMLLSVLSLAYKASLPLPKLDSLVEVSRQMAEADRALLSNPIWLKYQERVAEVIRVPESALITKMKVPGRILISTETILGPTLIFRIFFRLVSEKIASSVSEIGNWTSLPDGTPRDVVLRQIRQIARSDVFTKLVRAAATKRLPEQRSLGMDRIRSEPVEETQGAGSAVTAFMSATELALAIKALDEVVPSEDADSWRTQVEQVDKEIALSLEGAGDAWRHWKELGPAAWSYEKALEFARDMDPHKAKEVGLDTDEFMKRMTARLKNFRRTTSKGPSSSVTTQ